MIKYFLIIIACIYPSVSVGGWFAPSNYDECVLESMKGVTSDLAARAIIRSCRDKFPEKIPNDSEVPANVVGQLDGRARMTNYGYLEGSIYNGNKGWTITQITVVLAPKTKDKSPETPSFEDFMRDKDRLAPKTKDKSPNPARRAKEYNVDLSVPPLTNSTFTVSADDGGASEFGWSITKARGHKSH